MKKQKHIRQKSNTPGTSGSKRKRGVGKKKHGRASGLFLAPSLLGVLIFFVLPFVVVIFFSFVDNPISKRFVGLTNYINAIQNSAFRTAVGNTLLFSVIAIPLAVILGMALAFLLDAGIPMKSQLRSCFLTPLMVPIASIVLIFQVLFDYNGVVNVVLQKFGGTQVDWLKSSSGLFVIILMFLWKNLGYNMILFLSAIGNIPGDIIEVAQLDGAGRFQVFWHVKLRYLSPMIMFTTILSMINSFKVFREVYLLIGEYPYGALYMLQHYMNNTFGSADYQKLSTAAIYMSLVMIVILGIMFAVEHHFGKDLEEE